MTDLSSAALARKTIVGFIVLILIMGILMMAPAWTLDYWQAWLCLATFALCSAIITIYLWKKDRALLERRVNAGPTAEKEAKQKLIQSVTSLAFIGMIVVPSLDHRWGWSSVPVPVVIIGDISVALGFYFVFLVFRENSFAGATIQLAENQTVISTGPYAIVRHPMYAGSLALVFGVPVALGSWWGLLMSTLMALAFIWRLLDEEKFLLRSLPGYAEYCRKVRHRLLPLLW